MSKPHGGRVLRKTLTDDVRLGERCFGTFLDHPLIRGFASTSKVVTIADIVGEGQQATREIETQNSRYTLVLEGEASRMPGFPWKGDRMMYLGRNGYLNERVAAEASGFVPGVIYTVVSVDVSRWQHTITFAEIEGIWNGVMFERVP